VPFIGTAEAFVIKAAERAGVPKHRIRSGVEAIRRKAGSVEHALATKLVYIDGAEILLDFLDDDLEVAVAATSQRQFKQTVKDQLTHFVCG